MLAATLCVLYVMLRARQLDKTLPWFESETPPKREPATKHNAVPNGLPRLQK